MLVEKGFSEWELFRMRRLMSKIEDLIAQHLRIASDNEEGRKTSQGWGQGGADTGVRKLLVGAIQVHLVLQDHGLAITLKFDNIVWFCLVAEI